ncbi:hypothetical protein DVH24_039389 [Malus domestica]|uniref:Uncharacterized protein n=1 Tax=Malus domestica TaxID=3750 RepID=A0A498HXZ0_MALDO|nr:hypothetical protein DVH24_039389 [Malus domestica]
MVEASIIITTILGCSLITVSLKLSVARASVYLLVVPGICLNTTCLKCHEFLGHNVVWCHGYFLHYKALLDLAQDQIRVPYDSYLHFAYFPGCGKAHDESFILDYIGNNLALYIDKYNTSPSSCGCGRTIEVHDPQFFFDSGDSYLWQRTKDFLGNNGLFFSGKQC